MQKAEDQVLRPAALRQLCKAKSSLRSERHRVHVWLLAKILEYLVLQSEVLRNPLTSAIGVSTRRACLFRLSDLLPRHPRLLTPRDRMERCIQWPDIQSCKAVRRRRCCAEDTDGAGLLDKGFIRCRVHSGLLKSNKLAKSHSATSTDLELLRSSIVQTRMMSCDSFSKESVSKTSSHPIRR